MKNRFIWCKLAWSLATCDISDLKTGPLTFSKWRWRLLVDATSKYLSLFETTTIACIFTGGNCLFDYWFGHMPYILSSDIANLVILCVNSLCNFNLLYFNLLRQWWQHPLVLRLLPCSLSKIIIMKPLYIRIKL